MEKKAWRQLHKNAMSIIEKVLETEPYKAAAVRPPITHHKNYQIWRTRHVGHCLRRRDELISDVLLWIPSHGWAKAGCLARTYIQQLYADTGCSPEDLPEAMDNREGWRERVRNISADSMTWWGWYIMTSDVLNTNSPENRQTWNSELCVSILFYYHLILCMTKKKMNKRAIIKEKVQNVKLYFRVPRSVNKASFL